jgi:hypothetical protein
MNLELGWIHLALLEIEFGHLLFSHGLEDAIFSIPISSGRLDPFQVFSIVDFTVTWGRLKANVLQDLIERFHSLKRFKYEHGRTIFREDVPEFVPSAIVTGLRNCKHSLESLHLSADVDVIDLGDIPYELIEPMQGFVRLR